MFFIDFSSAFNTVILGRLVTKLADVSFSQSISHWIKDFLTNHPQTIRLGLHLPSTLSTGVPQGCVPSPLIYTLYTYDFVPTHPTNNKFSDNTTVVGLVSVEDETAYRDKVQRLAVWCSDNNFRLNCLKTKALIINFRKSSVVKTPLYINGDRVESVPVFEFLGTL